MDYLVVGRQLKHYVAPQMVDLTGWEQEILTEIATEKIKELKARLRVISEHHNQRLIILENIKDELMQFHRKIWEFQYQEEKYFIELWLKYWKGFISKPKVHPGALTPDDIQRAKQFPLEQLYCGQLKHVGGRFSGLCPFHKEKTPSFTIFSENNYHCFGCNAHGDSITYLMETKQLNFPQAVKELI